MLRFYLVVLTGFLLSSWFLTYPLGLHAQTLTPDNACRGDYLFYFYTQLQPFTSISPSSSSLNVKMDNLLIHKLCPDSSSESEDKLVDELQGNYTMEFTLRWNKDKWSRPIFVERAETQFPYALSVFHNLPRDKWAHYQVQFQIPAKYLQPNNRFNLEMKLLKIDTLIGVPYASRKYQGAAQFILLSSVDSHGEIKWHLVRQ